MLIHIATVLTACASNRRGSVAVRSRIVFRKVSVLNNRLATAVQLKIFVLVFRVTVFRKKTPKIH
jgi:hypothetical protein